jgi:hypothetical protein
VDDVTLLILDDRFEWGAPEEGGEVLATADGRRDGAEARAGECLVTLYGLASGATPEEIAVTTAHEYFHCVQYASLSAAQMSTYGVGGDWWVEGAAEYFRPRRRRKASPLRAAPRNSTLRCRLASR